MACFQVRACFAEFSLPILSCVHEERVATEDCGTPSATSLDEWKHFCHLSDCPRRCWSNPAFARCKFCRFRLIRFHTPEFLIGLSVGS